MLLLIIRFRPERHEVEKEEEEQNDDEINENENYDGHDKLMSDDQCLDDFGP